MDEMGQEQAVEQTVESPTQASVGTLLREARKGSGISIADAARQLKWGARQLEALEADDYDKLPGPTFVRGFIRNYAKLLHTDPQPMLEAYQSTSPRMPAQVIASQEGQISFNEHPKNFQLRYGVILVIALAVAGYALYEWSPLSGAKPSAPPAQSTPLPVPDKPVALPQPEEAKPAEPVSPAPKMAEPPTAPVAPAPMVAPAPTPAAVVPPPVLPDTKNLPSLVLSFSGDSWVEIKDRNGKIIFSQLSRANTQQTVQGNPPFDLVIGNAPVVKLSYKGKPVDLTSFTRAEVARIKLD